MNDQQTRDSQHKKNNLVMWVFFGIILFKSVSSGNFPAAILSNMQISQGVSGHAL